MRIKRITYVKGDRCLILSERSYCVFGPQDFVTKCLLIFILDEVKKFAANNLLQVSELIMYWDPCNKNDGVHLLKNLEVLKRQKVSIMSLSTGIVESRDKCFVLDLKLLFIIVNYFLERFPLKFFTVKLVCFIGFPGSLYLVLVIFPLHDFDMILIFVCFYRFYS